MQAASPIKLVSLLTLATVLACVSPEAATVSATVALTRHSVLSDGHPLAVWEKSLAAPKAVVVLLHGRTWSTLPDFDLQVAGEELSLMDGLVGLGYTTYGLDQRGYGATPRDETGWLTPDRAAEDLADVLSWIRARHPGVGVNVFGWSYGSMVSQLTAQRHPERIDRLVLFGYPTRPGMEWLLDEPTDPPARNPTTAAAAASDFIVEGGISETAVAEYVRHALEADPVRVDWRHQHEWNELDGAAVTVPTLVLHGAADPLAAVSAQAALFGSLATSDKAWIMVPGGDHAAFLESPRAYFLRVLDAFLDPGTS